MVGWFQMPGWRKHLSWYGLIIDSLLNHNFLANLLFAATSISYCWLYPYYIYIISLYPHNVHIRWWQIPRDTSLYPYFLDICQESPWYLLVSIEYPLWFLCLGYPPANEHVEKPPSIIFQGKPRKLLSKMVIRQLNVACSKIYVNCMLQ